jgi:DNA adenine methylase
MSVVNVASVPQRSPFRYPGGKSWFIPIFRKWIRDKKPDYLLEPFVGGGSIALCAAFEGLAEKVVMVELDPDIAAVWQAILSYDAPKLEKMILDFKMVHDDVLAVINGNPSSTTERAFRTILKNRVCHGGNMAAGSGIMKNGENGKGIMSRWYPETLARRIRQIHLMQERIIFFHGDGMKFIYNYQGRDNCKMFIDPPYTAGGKKAGRRLYSYNELDHDLLFNICGGGESLFLMTYDNAPEVKAAALAKGLPFKEISMKNKHHQKMAELLIGSPRDPDFYLL